MENEAPPSTGLIAGKYQLVGLIGRGGMGSVWEGVHTSLGTRVAIKFIESDYANSQEARTRFDNEARAAARIQSKHAIQIYDHGVTHDGKPYIVMEFLSGEPLDKRIDRVGRLSLQDTARIIQQVCRGLSRAHDLGIIHRDLKPENIFLVRSHDDDDEIAKVLDFGIAKIKGAPGSTPGGSGGVSSSTKTGAVLGTPFYMSPEQARGLRNVDHRTDIWSLGVITYKCVTGVLPFEGESIGDLLVKICTAPLPVPSQFLPGLPLPFDQWFARALDREPGRRFSTTIELADALAYTAGVSVRRPQSAADPAGFLPTAAITGPEMLSRSAQTPGGNATPRPQLGDPNGYGQGPSATSAPFTASARMPSSNRGVIVISSILAAVVALGVGFVALTKFMGPKPQVEVGTTKPSVGANGTQVAVAPPQPSLAVATPADAGAVAIAPLPVVPIQTAKGMGGKRPSPPAPPPTPPSTKPVVPSANVTPPPVLPPTPPPAPPPPPKPAVPDPGY